MKRKGQPTPDPGKSSELASEDLLKLQIQIQQDDIEELRRQNFLLKVQLRLCQNEIQQHLKPDAPNVGPKT